MFIIVQYAELNNKIFNLGSSTQEVCDIYFSLDSKLKLVLAGRLYNLLYRQEKAKMQYSCGGILMVQSQFDGVTPLDGAMVTFKALDNAHMIYVTNDYSHGVFPYGTGCVDSTVVDYFVNDIIPAKLVSCTGRSLVPTQMQDKTMRQDGEISARAITGENPSMSSTFVNNAQAQATMDKIHNIIINAEKRGTLISQ